MGRASDPLRQFRRTVQSGDLEMAMRMARTMPISLEDKLRLTILAGARGSALFDRMAIRWIRLLDDGRPLTVHELHWLSERFQDVRENRTNDAEAALIRFANRR